jgi:hypothetical protein
MTTQQQQQQQRKASPYLKLPHREQRTARFIILRARLLSQHAKSQNTEDKCMARWPLAHCSDTGDFVSGGAKAVDRVQRAWQNPMNSFRPKQWAGGSRRHDSSEIMHQQSKVRMIRSKQAGPSLTTTPVSSHHVARRVSNQNTRTDHDDGDVDNNKAAAEAPNIG